MLIAVQDPALFQMTPVLQLCPAPPASGAEDVNGVAGGQEASRASWDGKLKVRRRGGGGVLLRHLAVG